MANPNAILNAEKALEGASAAIREVSNDLGKIAEAIGEEAMKRAAAETQKLANQAKHAAEEAKKANEAMKDAEAKNEAIINELANIVNKIQLGNINQTITPTLETNSIVTKRSIRDLQERETLIMNTVEYCIENNIEIDVKEIDEETTMVIFTDNENKISYMGKRIVEKVNDREIDLESVYPDATDNKDAMQECERNIVNELIRKTTETGEKLNWGSIDDAFYYNYYVAGSYGVNQGMFNEYEYIDEEGNKYNKFNYPKDYEGQWEVVPCEDFYVGKKYLEENWKLSGKESEQLLYALDSVGACTYGTMANAIISQYINDPKKFEEQFGIPLYRQDSNGNYVINSAELMADMFAYSNIGLLILPTHDGTNEINNRVIKDNIITDADFMVYLIEHNGVNRSVKSYINSKSSEVKYENITIKNTTDYFTTFSVLDNASDRKMIQYNSNNFNEEILNKIIENSTQLSEDYSLVMTLLGGPNSKKDVNLYGWHSGVAPIGPNSGSHAVFITDITEDRIVISTWGAKGYVLLEDLKDCPDFGISGIKLE